MASNLSFNTVNSQITNSTSGNLSFGKLTEEVSKSGVQFKGYRFIK